MKRRDFLKAMAGVPVAMVLPVKSKAKADISHKDAGICQSYMQKLYAAVTCVKEKVPVCVWVGTDLHKRCQDECNSRNTYRVDVYEPRLLYVGSVPIKVKTGLPKWGWEIESKY